jgi:hypothetical protein
MPNATVRANARILPEGTNRRAVLGAVLAAGATVSLPAVAAASVAPGPSPDADLLGLIEGARIADEMTTDSQIAAENLLLAIRPSYPLALIWNETDGPQWCCVRPGTRISSRDVDFLRRWLTWPARPDKERPPELVDWGPIFPLSSFVGRAREIVQSHDNYEAAARAAREHPDVIEAEARSESLLATWRDLAKRVATTPAKTTEGILAKVLLIASGYAEDDLDGTYDGVLASLALDAQALAGERMGEDGLVVCASKEPRT